MSFELGRKVFFLYPPSVVKDELIARLLEQEYEVYMLKDVSMADRLIALFPDSIVFVNIDAGKSEREWEEWIRSKLGRSSLSSVGFGILTYNTDENLQRKYLMEIGIQCGFVKLKLGLEESTKILLSTLQANEAKGRRKYVRANCSRDSISSINLREGPLSVAGRIQDISVVGFSCTFDPDPALKKNTVLHDIQLKLRASLVKVEAIVFGNRMVDEKMQYVMLLAPRTDPSIRDKIRGYIQYALQTEIEDLAISGPRESDAGSRSGDGEATSGDGDSDIPDLSEITEDASFPTSL